MNRRKFLGALVGAAATVAAGMDLLQPKPVKGGDWYAVGGDVQLQVVPVDQSSLRLHVLNDDQSAMFRIPIDMARAAREHLDREVLKAIR